MTVLNSLRIKTKSSDLLLFVIPHKIRMFLITGNVSGHNMNGIT